MEALRALGDKLEGMIADEYWPLPTYREMLFTTPGVEKWISGVILYDETIRQASAGGTPFSELLASRGIIPGIKVDKGAKALALVLIEIVDLFLLGTVFLIIALGLYELFISDKLDLPHWLVIRTLDDLKHRLASVVQLALVIVFFKQVLLLKVTGSTDLFILALSILAVSTAIYLVNRGRH